MTPIEKANELMQKYMAVTSQYVLNGEANEADVRDEAKECALIAVEEIISLKRDFLNYESESIFIEYWKSVKRELENS